MKDKPLVATLETLETLEIESCAQVIMRAFKNDPLFTHALSSDEEKASFVRFLLKKSLSLGEKSIVMKDQTTILGVASYEKDSGSVLKGLINMVRFDFIREILTLKRMLSSESFAFFNRYMRFTTSVRPKAPHYYLVFIGIAPEAQGRGLGRAIIEEIHAHVDADATSVGIGLDTENEANIAYYETFGYKLIDQRNIDDVTVYAMFRSKS